MNFANIRNEEIIDFNSKYLDEDIVRIEVSQEIYQAYLEDRNKVMYKNGEVILNPNYEQEQAQKERERINLLSMTKREMFLGLYQAKGITPDMLKAQITDPQALIEFEYANDYYRGNPLIDVIGLQLGFTTEMLDKFFETKDYHELLPIEDEVIDENTTDTTDTTESDISI